MMVQLFLNSRVLICIKIGSLTQWRQGDLNITFKKNNEKTNNQNR